jgi:hypothetical protein
VQDALCGLKPGLVGVVEELERCLSNVHVSGELGLGFLGGEGRLFVAIGGDEESHSEKTPLLDDVG